jgi:tetratricopeptide (TPR) repeat protein
MISKKLLTTISIAAFILVGSSIAFAQTAAVRGRVEMEKDGKQVPVGGVTVEMYRVDIKSKLPAGQTNNRGAFSFAGVPVGPVYVIAVSGPGLKPELIPNVRAGMEGLTIKVRDGEGQQFTEDEVREWIALGAGAQAAGGETDAQKKDREELDRQIKEVENRNAAAKRATEIVNASLNDGGKAFEARNWDLAIQKFQEGIDADPDFAGSAPVLLNNKAIALTQRATDTFNKSISASASEKAEARTKVLADLDEAIRSAERALQLIRNAPPADAATQKNYEANRLQANLVRKNSYVLLAQTGVDTSRGQEATVAFEEYLALETDAGRKSRGQLDFAQTLQNNGDYEGAVEEFGKILANEPQNIDALVGMGLNLMTVGYITQGTDAAKGRTQLQEAVNYLQEFVNLAPDSHRFKADAVATIAVLREEQRVVPQAPTRRQPAPRRRP